MIGSTFKLSFDGSQVKRGLASLGGVMKSFGKQVAIGGSRQVGVQMTDFLGRMVSYLPSAAKETMDWAGELVDLSAQTGATVKDLQLLGEAFRMSGMESVDAGRMIGTMQKTLFNAGRGDAGAQEALASLGLRPSSFEGMDPIERLKLIIAKMNELKGTLQPGQMEDISTAIFGGKIGLKTLRIFENLPAALAQAATNLGPLLGKTKEELAMLDQFGDMLGVFEIQKKGLMISLMEGMFGKDMATGTQMIQSLAGLLQSLQPSMLKIGEMFKGMLDGLPALIDSFAQKGPGSVFSGLFESIGESIGAGFKKSLGESLNPLSFLGGPSTRSGVDTGRPLLDETEKQTGYLERIAGWAAKQGASAVFSP